MDIVNIRTQIAAALDADAALTALNVKVYNSRRMPLTLDRELCVYSLGTLPEGSSSLGKPSPTPQYRMGIAWITKFDESNFETEEDVCLQIEEAIYRVLNEEKKSNLPHWRRINFPLFSSKPIQVTGLQNVHYGRTEVIVK